MIKRLKLYLFIWIRIWVSYHYKTWKKWNNKTERLRFELGDNTDGTGDLWCYQ